MDHHLEAARRCSTGQPPGSASAAGQRGSGRRAGSGDPRARRRSRAAGATSASSMPGGSGTRSGGAMQADDYPGAERALGHPSGSSSVARAARLRSRSATSPRPGCGAAGCSASSRSSPSAAENERQGNLRGWRRIRAGASELVRGRPEAALARCLGAGSDRVARSDLRLADLALLEARLGWPAAATAAAALAGPRWRRSPARPGRAAGDLAPPASGTRRGGGHRPVRHALAPAARRHAAASRA